MQTELVNNVNCSNVVEKEAIVESITESTEKITIIDKQQDNSESPIPTNQKSENPEYQKTKKSEKPENKKIKNKKI